MLVTILFISALLVPVVIIFTILYLTADFRRPEEIVDKTKYALKIDEEGFKACSWGWLHKNDYGLWETYVKGSPEDRGGALGSMCRELLAYQEEAFYGFIRSAVKSPSYLRVLYWLTIIFIRKMAAHVPEEYRREISALSQFCGHSYDSFGTPYVRQLSYHAAHDIGHFMQDYMLVGCTAFAVWGKRSRDGSLLLARNFDFYAGEEFSKNKMILFSDPDTGYRYVSVTWPGMTGVVSGMNEKGLTVTLNASKGRIPVKATSPVSILARHILQYASDIAEAVKIAESFDTFVPETFTVASGRDGRAAVIEKTREGTYLYDPGDEMLICTNHFQSPQFDNDAHNIRNKENSDSVYRHDRVRELIHRSGVVGVEDAVRILRERKGKGDVELGLGNPKAVNQLMAHHSVIFSPAGLKMWVSTAPWQCGTFICYDLKEVFACTEASGVSVASDEFKIPEEEGFVEEIYPEVLRYRRIAGQIRGAVKSKSALEDGILEVFETLNPDYYETYDLMGDYMLSRGDRNGAVEKWISAREREIPTSEEREKINKKIKKWSGIVK